MKHTSNAKKHLIEAMKDIIINELHNQNHALFIYHNDGVEEIKYDNIINIYISHKNGYREEVTIDNILDLLLINNISFTFK